MNSTESENEITNEEVKPVHRNCKPTASWRQRPDGSYDNGPNDKQYWNRYYHEKKSVQICCAICGKMVVRHNIRAHEKTKSCRLKFYENKEATLNTV